MYTFRKFRTSVKALSPVIATIILIAVTVAVSIAVAAWMGGLTTSFMGTEQLSLGTPTFATGTTNGTITIVVKNTGTTAVTLSSVSVNNVDESINAAGLTTIGANAKFNCYNQRFEHCCWKQLRN